MEDFKDEVLKLIAPFVMVIILIVYLLFVPFSKEIVGESPTYRVEIRDINIDESYMEGVTGEEKVIIIIPLEGYPIKYDLSDFEIGDIVIFSCDDVLETTKPNLEYDFYCLYYSADMVN